MRMLDDLAPWGKRDNEMICADNVFNESIETDVEGIKSDGVYKKGMQEFPIFDVTEEEFTRNMEALRQRCRFKTPKVLEFVRNSKNRSAPFYIRTNIDGKEYIRRIK